MKKVNLMQFVFILGSESLTWWLSLAHKANYEIVVNSIMNRSIQRLLFRGCSTSQQWFPFLNWPLFTVVLKGKYQKKMSPTIRQWILSPKYILILKSFNPKSESWIFLSFQKFTGVQKGRKLELNSLLSNLEALLCHFEW